MLGPDPRKASKVEDDKMQGAAADCEDNDDEAETGGDTVTEGMVAMIREMVKSTKRKTAKEPKKSKAVHQRRPPSPTSPKPRIRRPRSGRSPKPRIRTSEPKKSQAEDQEPTMKKRKKSKAINHETKKSEEERKKSKAVDQETSEPKSKAEDQEPTVKKPGRPKRWIRRQRSPKRNPRSPKLWIRTQQQAGALIILPLCVCVCAFMSQTFQDSGGQILRGAPLRFLENLCLQLHDFHGFHVSGVQC